MFKNYMWVALRSLRKQKLFSVINLLGMAVGMAGFTLFALMAGSKLNADAFHAHADSIYCLVQERLDESQSIFHSTYLPGPLASALKSEFPEILDSARLIPAGRVVFKRGHDSFYENNALFVDPNFLQIFSFGMNAGTPAAALHTPHSIVLSERAASKYFGDEDPVGQVLSLGNTMSLTVTGITKDVPRTSSIRFDFLISMETARILHADLEDWNRHGHTAFLLISPEFDTQAFESKLAEFTNRNFSNSQDSTRRLYLVPFPEFRLHSQHITSFMASSHPATVFITLAIGVLLLFVVCINFINLGTARYMHRTKEIGLRKVVGASRRQLIFQFLGESVLLSIISLPAAVILYELFHPILYVSFGNIAGMGFTSNVSNSIWNYPFLFKYLILAAVLSGIFSGIYPALFLSSFHPVRVLKGKFSQGRSKKRGSKALIIFQFCFAVLFIAAASIIKHQFGLLMQADLGYNRQNIAFVNLPRDYQNQLELLKTKVADFADVIQVTSAAALPVVWENPVQAWPSESPEEEAFSMHAYGVDYGFVETLELKILQGRSFSRARADTDGFILSKTAAQKLGWEDPIGQPLTVGDRTGAVIGLADDFLFADIGFSMPPAVLYLEDEANNYLLVKYSASADFAALRQHIKTQWRSIDPDLPFACQTLDEYIARVFGMLGSLASFLNFIGIITILFSCCGLLGLASYMVEHRTKEIGIRKILGATTPTILWKMMREYISLVFVANVIALALLYFGWHKVLQTGLLFVGDIHVGTYVYALLFSLLTAMIAVTSQTWRATRANPADSLRRE